MRHFYNIIIFFILPFVCIAQKQKGDKSYENLEFHNAIDYYQSYLADHDDIETKRKLALCYTLTNQFVKAEETYSLMSDYFEQIPSLQLHYANLLLINQKLEKAKSNIQSYLSRRPDDKQGLLLLNSCNSNKTFLSTENSYLVSASEFKQSGSYFSPIYYGDKIVFTSENSTNIDKWTGRPFTTIYVTNNSLTESVAFEGKINGKYHNGAVCFTNNNNTMYFTRNSKNKNKNDELTLILVKAVKSGETWKFDSYFSHNSKENSTAYPTISTDGQLLIFASDRPGGYGGMDLYYCTKQNNKWSAPINMGNTINSFRDEVFPFFDNKGELYYASDGFPGLGGLDIFKSKGKIGNWTTPENLGAPINSSRDDFGLITKDELKTGYFSTNRNSGEGLDEILKFTKRKEILSLSGIVVDEYTGISLPNVVVKMKNKLTAEEDIFTTLENGRFNFEVIQDNKYTLGGTKNNIPTSTEHLSTKNKNKDDNLYVKLLHNDPRFTLNGTAQSTKTKEGVFGVSVILYNLKTQEEISTITDKKGDFHFQLDQNTDYEISGVKDGYYTTVSEASTQGLNRTTTLYVKLFLTIEEVIIGTTKIIGKEDIGGWHFDPIYYDLDKDLIRQDAAKVLNKIFDFLNKNPNLKIELGSHTDSRASDEYNMDLSDRRAKSAMKFLIEKGINSDKIFYKGYGETQLDNKCSNGIRCSEFMHQQNRRTEIKIIGK